MAKRSTIKMNKALFDQLSARASAALDKFDMIVEAKAKQELYPGHGKISGMLQRSIQTIPVRREGLRVVGGVKTAGVPYASLINRRYKYMETGFEKAKPSLAKLLRQ